MFVLFSVTGCQDRVLNVEDQNIYEWQKYMNEDEFKQLQPGMNYMDVVVLVRKLKRVCMSGEMRYC